MKLGLIAMGACAALAIAGSANAAPATANATGSISIVAPSQLTSTRNLDFGTVAKPTVGTTTVTVASAASGTATPAVSGGNGFVPTSGLARAATFHLVGTAGQTYAITASTLSFTGAAGNLGAVGTEAAVAAGGTLNTLPVSGSDDLYVGAHLDISPATAVAAYNGVLSLTINFN